MLFNPALRIAETVGKHMKRRILIIAVTLISAVSCKQNETRKVQITEQLPTVESSAGKEIEDPAIVNSKQFVENDSLQMQLYSDLEKLTETRTFEVDRKPVNNRHVDNEVDTIITQKADKIELTSYKTASEEWIYKAVITNADLKFSESIQVGMEKDALGKILKKELNSDLIEVGNLERTSVFIFHFEDEILREIEFDGYLD